MNKQDVGREEQPLEHDPSEMRRREQKVPETIQLGLVSHTQSHREGEREEEGEREGGIERGREGGRNENFCMYKIATSQEVQCIYLSDYWLPF